MPTVFPLHCAPVGPHGERATGDRDDLEMTMQLPLQISFHGMQHSDTAEAAVREKMRHLERFSGEIMSCRVAVDVLQKHHRQGRPLGVRIDLTLPGRELVVNRVENEDLHIALREAFDDIRRQLEDAVRQRRGLVKQHPRELHGEVVRLDDEGGFGFIRTPDGQEFYFGRDNLAGGRFEQLNVGSPVQFIAEAAAEGMQAKRVSVGKHHVE
jgi:ribosomal subunit interface protein